jgi:hypothetical protein
MMNLPRNRLFTSIPLLLVAIFLVSCAQSPETPAPLPSAESIQKAESPIHFALGNLTVNADLGQVHLSAKAKRVLAELVSNSTRLPQQDFDSIKSFPVPPMFYIRSESNPGLVFDWHGDRFLTTSALYGNKRAGNLWTQLAEICVSKAHKEERAAEIGRAIERYSASQ